MLQNLQKELHNSYLDLRALDRLIQTNRFEVLYKESTTKQQVAIYVYNHDIVAVKEWMKEQNNSLLEKTKIQLVQLAKKLQIRNYSRMSRDELLRILKGTIDE